jgi:hypothetical protein
LRHIGLFIGIFVDSFDTKKLQIFSPELNPDFTVMGFTGQVKRQSGHLATGTQIFLTDRNDSDYQLSSGSVRK